MKPIPLSAFIPPVTGAGGRASNVTANSFDPSNVFSFYRPRANSSKRMRSEDEMDLEHRFDLTRDYPPLNVPERQSVDVDAVSALLVGAAEAVPAIRAKFESPDSSQDVRELAGFSLKMFDLLAGVWERVVRPAVSSPTSGLAAGSRAPKPPPKPDAGKRELMEALAVSEKTSILYDANLGLVPIANRQKLNNALSVGIRETAVLRAERDGADPAEAVRVADDALSLVTNLSFMGQASRPVKDTAHCSMPIRLEFEDRGSRIHFERTIKAQCGIRATMSLPKPVRDAQSKFYQAMKERYVNEIVMVRVDTERLRFIAFHKEDQGPKWLECLEVEPIPYDILTRETLRTSQAAPPTINVGEGAAGGAVG